MDDVREASRRRIRLLAVGVAVAAVICGILVVFAWPKASAEPSASSSSTSTTVVYEAESAGTDEGSITLQAPTGTQQANTGLPLKTTDGETGISYTGFQPGAFVYLSVQNQKASGSVTCRITIKSVTGNLTVSRVISENTSTGGYVIASCQGQVR